MGSTAFFMRYIVGSLIVLFVLLGCDSQESEEIRVINYNFDDFVQEEFLKAEFYQFDSIVNPRKILSKGNYLIISEKGSDNLIHLLDKTQMKYLRSTGKQGEGPGEISSGIWELDAGIYQDSFWAYDLSGKSFHQYSLQDSGSFAIRTIRQNESWFLGYSIHQLGSNRFLSYVSRDSFKFGIFDSLGQRISSIRPWSYVDSVDEMTGYILLGLNQGPIGYSEESKILVHAGANYEFFEIINMESQEIIRLLGPSGIELQYEIKGSASDPFAQVSSDVLEGFRDVYVGSSSIFLIYIGQTFEESLQEGIVSKMIFEFSLSGLPKKIYHTDMAIRAISVDESINRIYAITSNKDPGIAVFDY